MKAKTVFWTSTGLLTAMVLFSTGMYLFNNDMITQAFQAMGYPTYLIYPLAFLKLAGVAGIWQDKCKTTREWAYAGLCYVFSLAFFGHLAVGDGQFWGALVALALLVASYASLKKR